jgi:plastocyanin
VPPYQYRKTAEKYYLPNDVGDNGNDVENPKATATTVQPTTNVQWCWKDETPCVMDRHDAEGIVGDPADCWIKYDEDSNAKLEVAFQKQGGHGYFSPMPGYVVSFTAMTQTKSATSFFQQRDVQRLVEDAGQRDNGAKQLGLEDAQV